jgi:hypothetical protein
VKAHCASLGLGNFGGEIPGIGSVLNFVTTFDSRTDQQPLLQPQPGGNFFVSQELRPRLGQPGVYEADYLTADATGAFLEYGTITLLLPSLDADHNSIPDFAQREYPGSVAFSGGGRSDWPYQNGFALEGNTDRSAGTTLGSYSLSLTGAAGQIAYTGSLYLVHLSGATRYTPGRESQMTFDLTKTERPGRSAILRGTANYTVQSADVVVLSQFVLNGSDGHDYTVKGCVLDRSGSTFRGAVELADGTIETSWPDYVHWRVELNDANDSDGDGIPDLSDASGTAPIITLQPTNQVAYAGSSVTFVSQATGNTPLHYQWFFDGVALADATSQTLTLQSTEQSHAGAYAVRVANTLGSSVSKTAALEVVPVIPAIPADGQVSGTVGWADTNATYRLDGDLLVPHDAQLRIAAGVTVLGQGNSIWVEGSLSAIGTKSATIRFRNVHLRPGKPTGDGTPAKRYRMELAFCDWRDGSIHEPTGHAVYGALILTDSAVTGVPYIHLWYPVSDCLIERNAFRAFGGINCGHRDGNVLVRNNVFHEPTPTYGRYFAVQNWAAYEPSQTIVEFNSFMFTNRVAVEVQPGYTSSKLGAVSNSWSSVDAAVIEGMINDRKDGTNFASVIPYEPFLADHHPGTPLPPPVILSGPQTQAVATGEAVEFTVSATGEPLRYQWRLEGTDIVGATNSTLRITSASPADAGRYQALVANAFGQVLSAEAKLSVSPSDGTPLVTVDGVVEKFFTFTNVETCAVSILTSIRNPSVFYTLDGSVPDFNGQLYSGSFPLRRSATIRAAVYDGEFRRWESEAVQANLHLLPPAVLVGSRKATTFDSTNTAAVLVALGQTMPAAAIYYTLDGSVPSTNSGSYSGPFVVMESASVRAMAFTRDLGIAMGEPVAVNLWTMNSLSATTAGGGTVLADPPGGNYRNDKVVRLEGQPMPGWTLLRWDGDWEATAATIDVPMDRPRNVRAVFGTTVTPRATGQGAVRLGSSPDAHPFGSVVQCVAVPEPGHSFAVWGGDASGNVNPLEFTVTNPTPVVSALFSPLPDSRHALTVIPNGRGSVTVTPRANTFSEGDTVTVQATPYGDARFLGWAGDTVGDQNPAVLTMSSSRVITANFSGGEYSLQLARIGRLPDGSVTMTVAGEPGRTILIEVSDDLQHWVTLRVLPNPTGVTTAHDPTATNWTARFYRASSP